eukprot:m51a1_g6684 hypothetical protein (100) ;mRNA; r:240806-241446
MGKNLLWARVYCEISLSGVGGAVRTRIARNSSWGESFSFTVEGPHDQGALLVSVMLSRGVQDAVLVGSGSVPLSILVGRPRFEDWMCGIPLNMAASMQP